MGNQFDRYEYESKDIHEACGYVRGSMGCEAAHSESATSDDHSASNEGDNGPDTDA